MTTTVRRYTDLIAWQRAMDVVESVYDLSKSFPKEERYGLTIQLRRAAVSVPSNIADARKGRREYLHHLSIAVGSLAEVETQLMIAQRLGYAVEPKITECLAAASETGRIIVGLMNSLERHAAAS